MLMLISPAKALDMDSPAPLTEATQCDFLDQSQVLIDALRELSVEDVAKLMDLSAKLSELNVQRYRDFHFPFSAHNAKQAVFAFNGDVYEGLSASQLNADQIHWLQDHLRILSGLYGLLRPLDYMQPYRLEMGTSFANSRGKNLYDFWGDRLTQAVNGLLAQQAQPVLVNLASTEYFSAIQAKAIQAPIVTPVFQDEKAGKYKIISFYAKKARGLMVRYAAERAVDDVQALKGFNLAGYAYAPEVSTDTQWVFRRGEGVVA
ncbi:MAG: peroxide stress protein YaaA [Gammaproteobacteria bacterium]|nr:peroxide stress protein YaaA [Gammaproteobacteria bacterium]